MSASEPHIPTPEEFADLTGNFWGWVTTASGNRVWGRLPNPPKALPPQRPQLTPLQILSLAQLFHDERELALELAADYGRRPLGDGSKKS